MISLNYPQVIVQGGKNRVERKAEHSRASSSFMFCANTVSTFLPRMVVLR